MPIRIFSFWTVMSKLNSGPLSLGGVMADVVARAVQPGPEARFSSQRRTSAMTTSPLTGGKPAPGGNLMQYSTPCTVMWVPEQVIVGRF